MAKAQDAAALKQHSGDDAARKLLDAAQVAPDLEEVRPPQFSDDALALDFADRHKDDLRYVAIWSRWLHFDGRHWQYDETLNVFDLVRVICRKAAGRAKCPSGDFLIPSNHLDSMDPS
jgi:phage/plasmid-associated DNA primase